MNKKYVVRLTAEERKELENLVKKGKTQAYRIKHANPSSPVEESFGYFQKKYG
jgi:predicted DNA-binding protein